MNGPVHGLSAGCLQGGQLSKAGGRGGCLVETPLLSKTRQFECQIILLLTVFV